MEDGSLIGDLSDNIKECHRMDLITCFTLLMTSVLLKGYRLFIEVVFWGESFCVAVFLP